MGRTRLFQVVLGAAIAITGCSPEGGTTRSSTDPPKATVGAGGAGANLEKDDDFVPDMAIKTVAAIELSRMALGKTASPEIKSFAQLVIGGHAVAGDKLKSVVSGGSIAWPAQLDDERRKTAEELAKKQGADFDREYLASMVASHEDLAAKLESRLDVQSLAEWKTAAAVRSQRGAMPSPTPGMAEVGVRANKSGNELTTKINGWAAETYPMVQKLLDTARTLRTAREKPSGR